MWPDNCPRFSRCSAPLCPHDADWHKRRQLKGEPVCFYLREAVKPGGRAMLDGSLPSEMAEGVLRAVPAMVATAGTLRRALQRASTQGSKLAAGVALRSRVRQ